MLDLQCDITFLRGASYNPRVIDDSAIKTLCESIERLGLVKPLIARGDVLVAGHQRSTALRKMGQTTAPVFKLAADANMYDEIRFNQLHNGTDMDSGDEDARITADLAGKFGYITVNAADITGNMKARGAIIRAEICKLILKYGSWGACVATESGEIIHCAQYALACRLVRKPLTVYVVPDSRKQEYQKYLNKQYGVFSYNHLERDTFVQTFAQMFRLRGGKRDNKSPTYERLIIPYLKKNPDVTILDFGCGQGDYVNYLKSKGYNIKGVEFFRRDGAKNCFDLPAINSMIDELFYHIGRYGQFDVVICDYVLNSVDSVQAENDVLNCINAFCKLHGKIFFSGRCREHIEENMRNRECTNRQRYVEFLDEHGFSGLYRKGSWFFQKFHSKQQVEQICKKYEWRILKQFKTTTSWNVMVEKDRRKLPEGTEESLYREFDMVLSKSGERVGRGKQAAELFWYIE